MLSRKGTKFLIDLPNEWVDKVQELLHETYQSQLASQDKKFKVFGKLYKDEALVMASLLEANSESSLPTTYFVSIDLEDGQDHTKLLDSLVDSIGAFFDVYFSSPDWMDHQDMWKQEEFKGLDLFVKVNRENVELTIQADQLLNQ